MINIRIAAIITAILTLAAYVSACSSSSELNSIALGSVTDYRASTVPTIGKGMPAPDFQIQMSDGSLLFLSELGGRVVLINFWAVNCPYCVKEMPYLQQAHDEFSADDIIILGINTGDSEEKVRRFVTDKKLSFPIILDPDIYATMLYKVQYLPTTYLVDKTGNIQIMKIGAFRDAGELVLALNSLLQ
jgi:peroxiredoxin